MREFTGAFLGTICAILFVCGVVAWLAWREMQKHEQKRAPEAREPELEREPVQPVAAARDVGQPSQVPS